MDPKQPLVFVKCALSR